MGKLLREWLQILLGLTLYALGVHLTIRADLGLAPWDCLDMGISNHIPLNYGLTMTALSIVILGIDALLKEKIGYGTIIDALLTGNLIQLFNTLDVLTKTESVWAGIAIIAAGLALMALGQFFYMRSGQCCGPKDALLVGIGKKLKFLPIGVVQILLWGTVLLIGWLLGSPVGIGTLVSTFGAGIVTQLVFWTLRFEPRNVQHESVIATTKRILRIFHK